MTISGGDMSIIGDVLAALKTTKEWGELAATARRIPELEKRIAALEARLAGGGSICPSCGKSTYILADSKPDAVFGRLGASRRIYRCTACGFSEEKLDT